ncbi:MAG: sulfite exporter TauE/SafE family protein [Chloroflexi bacterium]|nr:MAG: sulfite exporter TauE/SafE family protein [Chloroflexota bacterium]
MVCKFRIPPIWAVGTDIAYSTVTKAVGSIVHIRQKNVNFKIALWLACGSVPATIVSVSLVQYLRQHYNKLINGFILHTLGFTLLTVALLLIVKPWLMTRLERRKLEKMKQVALAGKSLDQMTLIGSLPGVFIGSKLSKYMPDKILRPLLAIVLAISG